MLVQGDAYSASVSFPIASAKRVDVLLGLRCQHTIRNMVRGTRRIISTEGPLRLMVPQ